MFGNQPRDNNIESLPPHEDPQPVTGDFAVKQEPPKGTPFRKPVVVTLILLLLVIAVFSLLYGLQPLKKKMPDEEAKERLNTYASSTHTPPGPELYETLPDSYAKLPDYASRKPSPVSAGQVGPGDPMVGSVAGTTPAAARSYSQASCTSGAGRNEEEDVAQSSLGFKISVTHPGEDSAPKLPDTSTLPPRDHQAQGQLPDDQNRQSEKRQFITQEHNGMTMLRNRLEQPHSPYMVMAGSIIPVTLITGINSDLPGNITAQVRENVFDTVTGKHLLIPQGAKINGIYTTAGSPTLRSGSSSSGPASSSPTARH